ncbi:MAG: thiazole biosynthesis adenylyltransferase ThiF [Planctomycetota bacterium]|nr:MAG: thiazole biosynthesis adenylyltransferase ThiF [Planctomycetota bacterium]
MSERHIRQERLPQVGLEGQRRLAAARVAIVGCGATGSRLAELLGRAGVGFLRLIDRDVVELSNLQRQALYTHADVQAVEPKAAAAARALSAIDPDLTLDPVVTDLSAGNAPQLLGDVDLVLDGTDNFPTRMVCNDVCVRDRRPFIYCGVVGIEGQVLVVTPGGPCLRCYVPELPAPGALPTCDTAGVLGTAVALVSALSAGEALKLLLGSDDVRAGEVLVLDAWHAELRAIGLPVDPACPCCGRGEYRFLGAPDAAVPTELCGRDAIQLPASGAPVDLAAAAERLAGLGTLQLGPWLLRIDTDERRVLLFKDGRVVVGNTRDVAEARSVRARLLGD